MCRQIIEAHSSDPKILLSVGALLLDTGFLTNARHCFSKAAQLIPNDLRPVVNLANLARDAGDHAESRRLFTRLLQHFPDNPIIRRNALTSLEYDPDVSDQERMNQARTWGEWAMTKAGGAAPRPEKRPLSDHALRVGYVSADFCQHTVGLLVRDVLAAHNPDRVTAFAYSAGKVHDWVTKQIQAACRFLDVSTLDDAALADLIRKDKIDVLVDLSGHTAGSRLTVFAHRPAPAQVSWLGYFATTGLPVMDGVLLDKWHAPAGTQAWFSEPVIRLETGRICYTPVPFAPEESAVPPCMETGRITFGCFNNQAKLNAGVLDVWAKILLQTPGSRLVLKWRTFNDDAVCRSVTVAFVDRGVAADRIVLQGPSFHADLLKEYARIDIALDPFPFTGGLTSCESLWMGVPVVTWPQSRVVSRQTYALVSAIGLPELAAENADAYVDTAVTLAKDPDRLARLRKGMRQRMQASPLMDVAGYARHLEDTLVDLFTHAGTKETSSVTAPLQVLHVGSGHRNSGAKLPAFFQAPGWREIQLDIDPGNEPDIVGSMLEMTAVESGSMDAIYSSHNIEHVHAHEVPMVLKEFLRVLKPSGFLVVTCPDLQAVCALAAEDRLMDTVYQSPAGPITPLDMIYGHGASLARGHQHMAHKCGFTLKTLTRALHQAGFAGSAGKRRARGMDIWVVAVKEKMQEAALRKLAEQVLPG